MIIDLQVDDLNSMYEEMYVDKFGDVDERDFFDKDGYLWIPFSETDSQRCSNLSFLIDYQK